MINKSLKWLFEKSGLDIKRLEKRKNSYLDQPAWSYQSSYILPNYKNTDRVLDIGCGHAPSPISTVLTDFFPDESMHRARPVVEDRPLVVCSVNRMPFRDASFDLSICSHVLEHVPDPSSAVLEIARVSTKGYLETPAYGKDVLVGTGNQHIWQIVLNREVFHFFPYTLRQHEAHVTSPVMNIWCQNEYHPWQKFFWDRQDIFNAIQFWESSPRIEVHDQALDHLDSELPKWKPVNQDSLPDIPSALSQNEISILERCLSTPDGKKSMHYVNGNFLDDTGTIAYPVRGKRIYFEIGEQSN
jgi:SAM-dependent methyltransferase